MKTLVLDIESAPHLAHVWSLWEANVHGAQLREVGHVMSVAYKWTGSSKVAFRSDFHDGHDKMLEDIHAALDEADAAVTYNGDAYDLKHLNREFLLAGLKPHSPIHSIDLYKVVKARFQFASKKLNHVSEQLGLGGKVAHSGHQLWVDCLNGDEKAWNLMRRYNKGDVVLTEKLYDALRPWIKNHPHVGLIDKLEGVSCRNCGGTDLQARGMAYAQTGAYQRYQCQNPECGTWGQATRREYGVQTR